MLAILSPAKSLDFETPAPFDATQSPALLGQSELLIERARELSVSEIRALMSVSEKIATLNHQRFQDFRTPFTPENAKPALFAFTGDVYTGLDAPTLQQKDLAYVSKHLRILSGLYGLLDPMDLMQPYRLEMGLKLDNQRGEDIYDFWGDRITDALNKALADSTPNKTPKLINLASNEYFRAVNKAKLAAEIIDIDFKENRDGKWKIISFSAKKARGMMARYMIDEKLTSANQLQDFTREGYAFNTELSSDQHWVFTRQPPQ